MKFIKAILLMALPMPLPVLANVDATFTGSIDSTCNVTSTSPGVLNLGRASEGVITVDGDKWARVSVTNNNPGGFKLVTTSPDSWANHPSGTAIGDQVTFGNFTWSEVGPNTFSNMATAQAIGEQVLENSGTDEVQIAVEGTATAELVPGNYSLAVTVTCVPV